MPRQQRCPAFRPERVQPLRVGQQLLRPGSLFPALLPLLHPADHAHRLPHRLNQQALSIKLAPVKHEGRLLGQRGEQIATPDPQRVEEARSQQAIEIGRILPHRRRQCPQRMDVVDAGAGHLRFDRLAIEQRCQRLRAVAVVAHIKAMAHVDRQAAGLKWAQQELGDHGRFVLVLVHQPECSSRPHRRAQLCL